MSSQSISLRENNIPKYLGINFTEWTSDIVLEWIPYNQFNEIKEISKNGLITVYSALWKDGPLYKKYSYSSYTRDPNKEVTLKCLHNLQKSIDSLINEAKKYLTNHKAFQVLYGISQNPNTEDYIFVLMWTSGNEKIDDFIQEKQLKINSHEDIVLEWIPYNQFNEIKEISKNGLITVYSALWKDGPLYKKYSYSSYTRDPNKEVTLKCLHNLQKSIDSLINEAKKYLTNHKAFQVLYGISQNPNTEDYIFVLMWTSGNEKIDDFIQEKQLKINSHEDIVLEWIPYNQFNEIKEISKNGLITVYSAIWEDGPLYKEYSWSDYTRDSHKKVALKCLHNSQESIDFLINETKKYPTNHEAFQVLYGISQNPDTGDYIFVQNYTINLANWISGNEKINDFIQEKQLEVINYDDIVLEWIPYNQFNKIKEIGKNGLITVYSAIWKDGPLYKNYSLGNYTGDPNKEVALKCLHYSQESIDSLINMAKKYPTNRKAFQVLYGISQNPDTGDYILVQNYTINWISGNEKIDDFIQEKQLKINSHEDIILEWIPYNQFNEIKEIGKNGLITVYLAIWKDGPLYKGYSFSSNTRDPDKEVALKCLHNSQESIDSLINEAKKYPTKHEEFQVLYGISQNPDTGDYVLVQNYTINWISGNEKIDDFIKERQLIINNYDDIVFEWILYNQFNKIKEISKNSLITAYSATWINGPLYYSYKYKNYTRDSNKEVVLKYLCNSQNSIKSLINEAKKYPSKHEAIQALYGITQNPDTGVYLLVQNNYNEVGKGGFAIVYSANWKNGPLEYDADEKIYKRNPNRIIALKYLYNSQNISDKFLNEVKKYSINKTSNILNIYGISQNPDTKEYIMCWDLNPNNRPNIFKVNELITSFRKSYGMDFFVIENEEIGIQFKKAEEYRKANLSSIKNYQMETHSQAIYTSRLLNSFTEDLPDHDDNTQCLDQVV
ncbi:uncharacterized protein OCT59_008413 [Rhizophagus irregularis]|uniref:uncharacterized protein n=1 Tax=Rhizophagus irregularis TaxID=588596 RepID=UPI0033205CD9|nr:hypothetical protein OCT59_008413 [Rhizophagus irregularis]